MIIRILSAAYSGSTLLDALLDSQPQVSAFGEVAQIWEEKPEGHGRGPCHLCGQDARACAFWAPYFSEGGHPYRRLAEFPWIVDASKGPYRFPWVVDRPVRNIVLVKAPHEWLASLLGHDGARFTPAGAWKYWEGLYAEILHFTKDEFLPLHYARLTKSPLSAVYDVCQYAEAPFDPRPIEDGSFWNRKSHALGGNPAVIDQLAQSERETGGRPKYLGGKYASEARWRKIRYDDTWERDEVLRANAAALYLSATPRLRQQLKTLRLGTPEELSAQMLNP